jgi:alanine racemase
MAENRCATQAAEYGAFLISVQLDTLAKRTGGELRGPSSALRVERIATDSRGAAPGALFVALKGEHTDGHRFLEAAFRNGAAAAMVSASEIGALAPSPQWTLVVVPDPLRSLQALAAWQRREYFGKVLAITGSNGKTIVKDALKAMLAGRRVLASPGSYNSQLGLPLAVLSAESRLDLAILEAGISAPGEMARLEEIAAPDFGILTNIGMAHFAAFGSREAIAREKMVLFRHIAEDGWLLLPGNEKALEAPSKELHCRLYPMGGAAQGDGCCPVSLSVVSLIEDGQLLELTVNAEGRRNLAVKTRSPEIIADLHLAAVAAHLLGVSLDEMVSALDGYVPNPTRMELWSSPQGIRIINDAYSADPMSVQAALRSATLGAPLEGRKIFVFAGMHELGTSSDREHRQVGAQAGECGYSHVLLVGNGDLKSTADGYMAAKKDGHLIAVPNPKELKNQLLRLLRPGDTVLFKGPRHAGMVEAVQDFSGAIAQRCQWIDLGAIEGNIARLRRRCGGAHILAMLKAMAYRTELVRLGSWMSRLGIHHIGVSSASEGVDVRRTGAEQDILVFLADPEDIDNLCRYRLTPVIHSRELVESFTQSLSASGRVLDVHLKVDTGMHRLGVEPGSVVDLARRMRDSGWLRLAGVCTHFSSADDPKSDAFTLRQIAEFDQVVCDLRAAGFDQLRVHAANTAAAIRFPEARYDLVRIGLGLYGLYPSPAVEHELNLELAIGVTSRISSVQEFPIGSTLGYNRTFTATRKIRVGVVPFGYDDGLPWALSGTGEVLVEGHRARIVGRISMDQMQVDVTDIPGISAGAEVLIYGARNGHVLRPEEVAGRAGTISHELLTRLGERVHRIYVEP